jgi:hypothetical protein
LPPKASCRAGGGIVHVEEDEAGGGRIGTRRQRRAWIGSSGLVPDPSGSGAGSSGAVLKYIYKNNNCNYRETDVITTVVFDNVSTSAFSLPICFGKADLFFLTFTQCDDVTNLVNKQMFDSKRKYIKKTTPRLLVVGIGSNSLRMLANIGKASSCHYREASLRRQGGCNYSCANAGERGDSLWSQCLTLVSKSVISFTYSWYKEHCVSVSVYSSPGKLLPQSTYRGRVEIGGCICPLSWSIHHNFAPDCR